MENMEKLKNMKMPRPGGAGLGLGALLGAAGLGIYTLSNCLFNVEGGHRAIVFNRLMGIKEDVSSRDQNESAHRLRACPLWGALATRSPATNGVVPSRDPRNAVVDLPHLPFSSQKRALTSLSLSESHSALRSTRKARTS